MEAVVSFILDVVLLVLYIYILSEGVVMLWFEGCCLRQQREDKGR